MAKKGLLIDYMLCTGCHSCEASCKVEKNLEAGVYGIKLNDGDADAWQIDENTWEYKWIPTPTQLCDLCEDRIAGGKPTPLCVLQCCAHCMHYGDLSDLVKKMDELDRPAVLFTIQAEAETVRRQAAPELSKVPEAAAGDSAAASSSAADKADELTGIAPVGKALTTEEFLALSDEEQMEWLVAQTDAGRSVADICEGLGCTRADLQGFGYTWALDSWRFLSMGDRAAVVAQN